MVAIIMMPPIAIMAPMAMPVIGLAMTVSVTAVIMTTPYLDH